MREEEVKRCAAVFAATDRDRDGKITGEEARKLLMGYRLPIQVWIIGHCQSNFCCDLEVVHDYAWSHW